MHIHCSYLANCMLDVAIGNYRIGLPLYREKLWLCEATHMYVRTRRFARDRQCPQAQCIVRAKQILWTFSGVWGDSFKPPEPPLATRLLSLACFFEASHKHSATKTAKKINGYLSFFAVSYYSHLRLSRSHAYTYNSSGSNSLCKTIVRTRSKWIGSGFKPDP